MVDSGYLQKKLKMSESPMAGIQGAGSFTPINSFSLIEGDVKKRDEYYHLNLKSFSRSFNILNKNYKINPSR